jgi:hypothetical protein
MEEQVTRTDLNQFFEQVKSKMEEIKDLKEEEFKMTDKLLEENAKKHQMEKSTFIRKFGDDSLKTRYKILNLAELEDDEYIEVQTNEKSELIVKSYDFGTRKNIPVKVGFRTVSKGDY